MAEIDGTSHQDVLTGTAGADTLSGGDGSDRMFGGLGGDVIYGHSVADTEPGSYIIDAERVAAGLSEPLFAASPAGDPDRLFIVEQHTGRIRILDLATGQLNGDSFLDLPDGGLASGQEQGLLGLAFHPDYATNGIFYVNLTNAAGDTEVREYRRADADHANGNAPRAILGIDQPFANHNGGWMGFGPDRLLYIATGDGGGAGDPLNNAQDKDSLLGKILRIDVDGDSFPADTSRNYAIPGDNPFAGATAGADEVWLYGLRHPWRVSFDAETGALWMGDAGEATREEVDFIPPGVRGLDLGWKFKEGFSTFSGNPPAGLTDPLLDYDRTSPLYSGFAVIGGYVYHGPGGADGLYVFGDFGSGNLWTVSQASGRAEDFLNRNGQLEISGGGDIDQISSFAVDGSGRLYVIGLDGDIHRLSPRAAAGDGFDYLRGEQGNDTIFGGAGNDDADGGEADDFVQGNFGEDVCEGGPGADIVRGGQGKDVLRGGDGDDFLSGDRGDDTITGGLGADIFNSFGGAGLDLVTDFNAAEGDRVRLDPGATFTASQQGADTVVEVAGGARVVLASVSLATLTGDWVFVG